MKRRTLQIGSELEKAINDVLARGLADPRAKGLITVTGVEVVEDLSAARVMVSIHPEEHEKLTMHALASASGYLRREVMKRVHLRLMPVLIFKLDTGLKNQAKVFELLGKIAEERAALEEKGPATEQSEDQSGESGAGT